MNVTKDSLKKSIIKKYDIGLLQEIPGAYLRGTTLLIFYGGKEVEIRKKSGNSRQKNGKNGI